MSLSILYEDDALLFVNKPPTIVVQRGYDPDEPVLIEIVNAYLEPKNERAFLMQRLDRGTSGVIFFSKLSEINSNLTRQFETKRIRKDYVALCERELAESQTIDAPLARIGPISFGVRDHGKRAVTNVKPIVATPNGSFVDIELLTGRTHQIRAHLAAIGHPLVGDWLYGERNAARPMLHARSIALTHPKTREPLIVEASLPEDFLEEARKRGILKSEG